MGMRNVEVEEIQGRQFAILEPTLKNSPSSLSRNISQKQGVLDLIGQPIFSKLAYNKSCQHGQARTPQLISPYPGISSFVPSSFTATPNPGLDQLQPSISHQPSCSIAIALSQRPTTIVTEEKKSILHTESSAHSHRAFQRSTTSRFQPANASCPACC